MLHIVLTAPPVFVDMRFADALVIHLFFYLFLFCWRYLRDLRASLHQIFQEDGKMGYNRKINLLVSELFRGWVEV